MHVLERVLLYAIAVACGALLLVGDENEPAHPAGADAAGGLHGTAASDRAGPPASSREQAIGSAARTSADSLVLKDAQERPRIELRVDHDGHPHVALKSESGVSIISLGTGPDQTGEIVLDSGRRRAVLASRPDGTLALELTGSQGAQARMLVAPTGETEIAAGGGPGRIEAILQTDRQGGAEIAIRGPNGKAGPRLALLPTGDGAIGINRQDGTAGPLMQLFRDGLAEIAIGGGDSKSGPSMIRMPDGISVVSVRLDDGQPGASMVASPDGTSVVAATSSDGKQQAALRIDRTGKANITLTEPDGTKSRDRNSDEKPHAKPARRPGQALTRIGPDGE